MFEKCELLFDKYGCSIVVFFAIIAVCLFIYPNLPPRLSKETKATIKKVHELGGKACCYYYPYITYLDLSMCRDVDDEIFSELFRMNALGHLKDLDLSNTGITKASLKYCKEMPDLRLLNLSNTCVTHEEIECYLKDHPSIFEIKLNLSHDSLSDTTPTPIQTISSESVPAQDISPDPKTRALPPIFGEKSGNDSSGINVSID